MHRRVEPEILDTLPADDPEAIRSRKELRWINAIMGNHRWMVRRTASAWRPSSRVLELGAGDGTFGNQLIGRSSIPAENLHGVDLAPRPKLWPSDAHWQQGDLFAAPLPPAEIVVANLFLHHFEDDALRRLGERLPPECRIFLASEPARRTVHLWQGRLLRPVLGKVTRHDMPVSIRAGFLGDELPRALALTNWRKTVSVSFFGAYRLQAIRL